MTSENQDTKVEENKNTDATKTYTNEELQNIVRMRLKEENQKREEAYRTAEEERKKREAIEKRLLDLEKKNEKGTATQDEKIEYQNSVAAAGQAKNDGIPPEAIPHIVEISNRNKKTTEQLNEAIEKDEEFKNLAEKGNPISGEEIYFIGQSVDNTPAVIKHLLKDKRDYDLFQIAKSNAQYDGGLSLKKLIYEFSDKLNADIKKPSPSGYTPAPDLSDTGAADQDFNDADYVKNNPPR